MRSSPVVEFTQRFTEQDGKLRQVADVLRAALGRVCDLIDVSLLYSNAGQNVPAGATVTIEGTYAVLDLADDNVDSVRLIVRGKTAAAGPITLEARDVTNSVTLATVTVTTGLATNIGAWTQLVPVGGDRTIALRVVGDGANAQTLYTARLQARTNSFRN